MIELPKDILYHFITTARTTFDKKGKYIELLAYFIGHIKEDDQETHVIDGILYPKQSATASGVNDNGE